MNNELPYEIRMMGCNLFAGKTGFNMAEMQSFFREEIKRRTPPPELVTGEGFFMSMGSLMSVMSYEQKLRNRDTAAGRKAAFAYWLSMLPIAEQIDLLLMLCCKPDFPMHFKAPSASERNRLAALLNGLVIESSVAPAILLLDSTSVLRTWEKAIERCANDPSGAITMARVLLESICKHLLDECHIIYGKNDDFPKLYSQLAQKLQITPGHQSDLALKQMFGGCYSVVNGVAALRNESGDAHGHGRNGIEPTPAQAKFAVNCAGSAAQFLIETWEALPQSDAQATGD